MRLDLVLVRCFLEKSRNQIRRAIDRGLVLCDGQIPRPGQRIRAGQEVRIRWPEEKTLQPKSGKLVILFEDETLIAINKPAGIVVHPTPHGDTSLVELLLHHTKGKLAAGQDPIRPGVVHRLDRDTTGVLLFAKEKEAFLSLQRQFQRHQVEKCYHAIVAGHPNHSRGTIDKPIGRDHHHRTRMTIREDGRPAYSEWKLLRCCEGGWSHLAMRIHSGRTHQIRVHLAFIGHPILGDRTYGRIFEEKLPPAPRILLHAAELCCTHPHTSQPLHLRALLPEDFVIFSSAISVRKEPVSSVANEERDGDGNLSHGFDGKK